LVIRKPAWTNADSIVALVDLEAVIIRPHRKEDSTWQTWSSERIEK